MSRLIVCERGDRWGPALEALLAADGIRRVAARSLVLAEEELRRTPQALVVVEIEARGLLKVVAWLSHARRKYPDAPVAIVGERHLAQHLPLLCEAGAVCCLWGTRRLGLLADLARRRLAGTPHSPLSLTEAILARLPWGDAAGAGQ
jgi:DNA-binding response OmpR family regulator